MRWEKEREERERKRERYIYTEWQMNRLMHNNTDKEDDVFGTWHLYELSDDSGETHFDRGGRMDWQIGKVMMRKNIINYMISVWYAK